MKQEIKDAFINVVSIISLIVGLLRLLFEPSFESLAFVLATLATVVTLYVSKRKIEKAERRYITKPKQLFRVSVGLCGSAGSGKTWLCYALGRVLETKYNREIDGLSYCLEKTSHLDFSRQLNYPTADIEDFVFKFERSRTSENFGQSISSFQHQIHIVDNRGDETTGMVLKESASSESRRQVHNSMMLLAGSDVVILALDHGVHSYTKEEYSTLINDVLSFLETARPDKKRYYAVCFMKADKFGESFSVSPESLIELHFGREMMDVLRKFDQNRMGFFTVSSAGYIYAHQKLIPNIDVSGFGELLLDENNWKPYGVEFPFFWAFENLERDILVEKFSQSWWGKLTIKSKIKKHIPYPKINYEISEKE